jgi:SAM-dependent methyltransferase
MRPESARHVEYLATAAPSDFPEDWYELAEPDHFWFRWRLAALLRQARSIGLPLDQPLRGLDIGAGTGALRTQLEACSAWVIDVADLNPAALSRARPGRGRTLCYDVTQPHPSLVEAYDLVILFDVIEHIEESRAFLRSALRHLRPGGHVLVNVPSCPFLYGAYDVAAGHVRRYDRISLPRELEGTDVQILDLRYWGLTMVPLLLARKVWVRGDLSANERVNRGFQPPGRAVHALLRGLAQLETSLLKRPPLGSSLLMAGRKAAGG